MNSNWFLSHCSTKKENISHFRRIHKTMKLSMVTSKSHTYCDWNVMRNVLIWTWSLHRFEVKWTVWKRNTHISLKFPPLIRNPEDQKPLRVSAVRTHQSDSNLSIEYTNTYTHKPISICPYWMRVIKFLSLFPLKINQSIIHTHIAFHKFK